MIVVDTNIIVYLYTTAEYSSYAEALLKKESHWTVPYLWRSEYMNVLAFLYRQGNISLEESFHLFYEARMLLEGNEFHPDPVEVLSLAAESGASAYDCEYISLARYFDTYLITMDRKLLSAFPKQAIKLTEYA